MLTFYPAIKPYDTQMLPVGDGHTLYLEQSGSPDGIPVVVLHGGPGAGNGPNNRRFFDPNYYRIILFDQRGAGASTPHAGLEHNTTEHLVSDIEKIRRHLNIDRWIVFGGSWGSTLALTYAIRHPQQVTALILRGVWLLRQDDIDWIYQCGTRKLFPEHWENFIQHLAPEQRQQPIENYYALLTGKDEIARMSAAKAWGEWEAHGSTLEPSAEVMGHLTEPHTALSFSRICCHYVVNKGFIPENYILDNIKAIQSIPGFIIHGRYDALCPVESAWLLHQYWPKSELMIVRAAGHSALEPAITDALIHATQRLMQ